MDTTEDTKTDSNESDSNESTSPESPPAPSVKTVVGIPVTVTVVVPVEVDLSLGDVTGDIVGELDGTQVMNIEEDPDTVNTVLQSIQGNEEISNTLASMVFAAQRIKDKNSDINIYYTPWGGVIDEEKI